MNVQKLTSSQVETMLAGLNDHAGMSLEYEAHVIHMLGSVQEAVLFHTPITPGIMDRLGEIVGARLTRHISQSALHVVSTAARRDQSHTATALRIFANALESPDRKIAAVAEAEAHHFVANLKGERFPRFGAILRSSFNTLAQQGTHIDSALLREVADLLTVAQKVTDKALSPSPRSPVQ